MSDCLWPHGLQHARLFCLSPTLKSFSRKHLTPQFSSVQLLSRVQFLATPWTAAHQASLSITNSWSPPKPMSIESVMPSNHLILWCPLLLLPSIFPSIRGFSNGLPLTKDDLGQGWGPRKDLTLKRSRRPWIPCLVKLCVSYQEISTQQVKVITFQGRPPYYHKEIT